MDRKEHLTQSNWQEAVFNALAEFPADLRAHLRTRTWSAKHLAIAVIIPTQHEAQWKKRLKVTVRADRRREGADRDKADTSEAISVSNESDPNHRICPVGKSSTRDLVRAVQEKIMEEMLLGGLITRTRDLRFVRFDESPVIKRGK